MKNMIQRILIFSFFLTLVFSSRAQNPFGFTFESDSQTVELYFRKESNLIIIPIKINGNGPYDFIFDTGSKSGLIFEKKIIADYDMKTARKIPIYAKKGEKLTELIVANNLKIDLYGVSGENQSMFVLDENIVEAENVLGSKIHGVLGSAIFNRFVVEIDYEKQSIKLHEPSTFKNPRGYKAIPIDIQGSRPYVRVKLKQKGVKPIDIKLLVDSGASSALFLDEAHNKNIFLPKKTIDISLGRGLTGNINGKVGRVQRIKIGGYRFSNLVASYPNDWGIGSENDLIKDMSDIRYGTLGSDLLSRFNIIFDYMHNTMYIKKNASFGNSFVFNTVGLSVMAMGIDLNTYIVADIIKGSQADKAGIKVDDEIISLNGSPAFFYSLTDINTMLTDKPGTLLTLILRREKNLLKKVIRQKRVL